MLLLLLLLLMQDETNKRTKHIEKYKLDNEFTASIYIHTKYSCCLAVVRTQKICTTVHPYNEDRSRKFGMNFAFILFFWSARSQTQCSVAVQPSYPLSLRCKRSARVIVWAENETCCSCKFERILCVAYHL